MWLLAWKSVAHLLYRGWAKVLPAPVSDDAGVMDTPPEADPDPDGLEVVVLFPQAAASMPRIAITTTNNLVRLIPALPPPLGPLCPDLTTDGHGSGGPTLQAHQTPPCSYPRR